MFKFLSKMHDTHRCKESGEFFFLSFFKTLLVMVVQNLFYQSSTSEVMLELCQGRIFNLFFYWEIGSCLCCASCLATPLMLSKGKTGASTVWYWYHCRTCYKEISFNIGLPWDYGSGFYSQGLLPKCLPWLSIALEKLWFV